MLGKKLIRSGPPHNFIYGKVEGQSGYSTAGWDVKGAAGGVKKSPKLGEMTAPKGIFRGKAVFAQVVRGVGDLR